MALRQAAAKFGGRRVFVYQFLSDCQCLAELGLSFR